MGRPPCCDKEGIKKGPWTPEEDILLVSYIQEHGPGNWKAIPSKTGLLRCSKSCRLRWTNYLRPGIKRGNFTNQEENMIIHLQALLGNRWAAIASYLPQRTDNDIKNYWNTYLKKRLSKKLEEEKKDGSCLANNNNDFSSQKVVMPRGQWERRLQTDINMAKKALTHALSPQNNNNNNNNNNNIESLSCSSSSNSNSNSCSSNNNNKATQSLSYASNADNIARLLKGWMKKNNNNDTASSKEGILGTKVFGNEECLESSNNTTSSLEFSHSIYSQQEESKTEEIGQVLMPFHLLEKWLLDETNIEKFI
ncbi:hypothetical protein HN51_032786 [Arachis hypogaea]|uniref:Uncharacterized protein n=1 Tax=Arachis hypogaea TaxID=3818 RepID=A0A445B371_ARAHY|nr:transcription factor MYB30 [Arachis hypogaea]QHO17157.1 Myb-related protein [Arachis hypogaea]RYR33109.1 hypothetical protein Ahy_A10g047683 [Arachis hypogaea]